MRLHDGAVWPGTVHHSSVGQHSQPLMHKTMQTCLSNTVSSCCSICLIRLASSYLLPYQSTLQVGLVSSDDAPRLINDSSLSGSEAIAEPSHVRRSYEVHCQMLNTHGDLRSSLERTAAQCNHLDESNSSLMEQLAKSQQQHYEACQGACNISQNMALSCKSERA